MDHSNHTVSIARWRDDKSFAYSITYDEGLIEIAGFAWRIHRGYGIPGHMNVFPDMLGKLVGDTSAGFLQSLWHLQKYAEPEQLQFLISEGWSIGCQFSSTGQANTVDSISQARLSLGEALSTPIQSLAFNDFTSGQDYRQAAEEAGYCWLLVRYDDLNSADENTNLIKRSPLYHQGPTPIRLANDPYRLLALARDRGGWLVDVVRLVDRFPSDPARDCTPDELEARFKAVRKIGGDQVWIALPETIAAYRTLRLSTQIESYLSLPHQIKYSLAVASPGDFAGQNELTFVVQLDSAWQSPLANIGGRALPLQTGRAANTWLLTHPVADGLQIEIVDGSRRAE